jgi:cytochrome bd-type quinol oxidase subunit 2
VLAVLLGSTAFDGFSATPDWRGFLDQHAHSAPAATLMKTAGLLLFAGVVAGTFWLAARATGGVDAQRRRELPGLMAHSLIPIVIGYVFAHYLSYLAERGQQTVIQLLGLEGAQVHYVLSMHPPVLASIKVACVVAGHIAAVIAAHDRALRLLPTGHQLTGQLAMMLVMVGYTFTGLYLLFGG